MATLKDKLKNLTDQYGLTIVPEPESVRRAKEQQQAAKKVSEEIKKEKGK